MNIINFKTSYMSIINTDPIKSFSEMAYVQQKISDKEIYQSLKLIPITLTPPQEQTASIFHQILPLDIKNIIFNLLDKKDLQTSFLVCKEFALLAKPIYVQKALHTIAQDFTKVESDMNLLLRDVASKMQGEISISSMLTQSSMPPLDIAVKKLTLFKSHCVFLYNNSEITKERLKVKDIFKSTMQLLNACNQIKAPQENGQMNSRSAIVRMKDIIQNAFYKPYP